MTLRVDQMLNARELDLLDDLRRLTVDFASLSSHRPGEREEWMSGTHRLQDLIMSRAAARAFPDRFTPLEPTEAPALELKL